MPEEDTDRSEGGVADGYAGLVGEASVAGKVVKVVGAHDANSMEIKVGSVVLKTLTLTRSSLNAFNACTIPLFRYLRLVPFSFTLSR